MNDKLIEVRTEIAKSWFTFAQITVILAGFLFTASGVAWNNSQDTINRMQEISLSQLDRIDQIILTPEINVSNYNPYLNATANANNDILDSNEELLFLTIKWGMWFLIFGIIFAGISFIFLIIENHKQRRLQQEIERQLNNLK